ncbi:Nn.00g013420.m01.CDS01 [Neocucurbitaria sp. VM-36]
MRFTQALVLVLPGFAVAYPGMMSTSSLAEHSRRKAEPTVLNPVGNLLGSLGDAVSGLLNSVGQAVVVSSNKRPEPGYEFQAPGPNDSRGPCPGLNLLANYGYLPRDGHVTFGQVLEATGRGFNMGADLATVLATFAVLGSGDLDGLSFYLGAGKNGIGGLNRHSTVEADVSPNREDYYNGCGDNHHLSSRLVKQMVNIAAKEPTKEFNMNVMASHYAKSASFSKKNNPYLYYFPFPQIVSLGAFAFYPNFFSNGTYGAGGVPNYESIMSIIGAEYDEDKKEFKYVPEKWPENWYRRATPYGAVQTIIDGFLNIYPRNIIVPLAAQVGTPNLNPQTLLCDVYQGLNSITPLAFGGSLEKTGKAISWALSVLDPHFSKTALGCPDSVLSPNFLYPEAAREGGPATPPTVPSDANTGDNVYDEIYFRGDDAPITPQCGRVR